MGLQKIVPRPEVASLDTPAGKSGLRVAVFPGCMVDKVYPRVGLAMLKILEHHGVGVFMPAGQACCGIPALSSGDRDSYDRLVAANMALFSGQPFDYLVTPCATCTATIRKTWPAMAQGSKEAQAAALAAKAMDVNAFLADVLKVQAQGAPGGGGLRVTVHDPCHLKKSLGVAAQPRALMAMNPAVTLVEMPASDACCGCGGSFTLMHPDISADIGRKKLASIRSTGADVVAAGCPACMLQLTDMLSRAGENVAVRHPLEIYAETLG